MDAGCAPSSRGAGLWCFPQRRGGPNLTMQSRWRAPQPRSPRTCEHLHAAGNVRRVRPEHRADDAPPASVAGWCRPRTPHRPARKHRAYSHPASPQSWREPSSAWSQTPPPPGSTPGRTCAVLSPTLWQVEPAIHEGLALATGIGQEHTDLAVLDPACRSRILARHPSRVLPLLQKSSLIDDQHTILVA